MSAHWYTRQTPPSTFNFMMDTPAAAPSSNHREIRNKLEKQRRDRLNTFIAELAKLVPIISQSSKRLDKISILRLAATYLRIIQMLDIGKNSLDMKFPKNIDQFVLEQLICEQLGGFLLIVTPTGKIVFVSHSVENLLGHLQIDLMGQSLYQITAPDYHDILRLYLQCDTTMDSDWRRYFKVKMKKAGPRSETTIYEEVRMTGVHILLNGETSSMSSSSSTSTVSSTGLNYDIMLFFAQMCRPEPLSKQLLEATKDEYKTRHLIDGRIIDSDQRISFVAGYLIEEVSGQSAFNYMHRDDVRWVIIALRQMYDRKECYGDSCYRLQTGTGQFIYLRSKGYLEIDDQGLVESFVCINTMVSEKEGKYLIHLMKKRYSALIHSTVADSSAQSPSVSLTPPPSIESVDLVEDPEKVQEAVSYLMTNLEPSDQCSTPSPPHPTTNESQDWPNNIVLDQTSCTVKMEPTSPKETNYQERLKTAIKRSPSSLDTHPYDAINGNSLKRMKTSPQLSPRHHEQTTSLVVRTPCQQRKRIMSDSKMQPEKSIYTHDYLLKQILQRK